MKIALILITKNNEKNVKTIIDKFKKYINNICLYDLNSEDDTINVVKSLSNSYQKEFKINDIFSKKTSHNILIDAINQNITDNDYLLILNGNDNVKRLDTYFLDNLEHKSILFYELQLHDKHNEIIDRTKLLLSNKCEWKVNTFTNYIYPVVNLNNDICNVDLNNWIQRSVDYSYNNLNKLVSKYLNDELDLNEELDTLLVVGDYFIKNKTYFDAINALSLYVKLGINKNDNEYLLYMGHLLLSKVYMLTNANIKLITNEIGNAIKLIPTMHNAYSLMGNYLYDLCLYDTSYALLKDCLSLENNNEYPMHYKNSSIEGNYNIIFAAMLIGEMEEAKKYLNMLKELNDKNFTDMINIIEKIISEY